MPRPPAARPGSRTARLSVGRRSAVLMVGVLAGVTGVATMALGGVAGAAPELSGAGGSASLASLLVAQPLPDYQPAPPGPTNGVLSAAEFASQSSDPGQAEQQFDALADRPGSGATIRLWTDVGPGRGQNDVAELLFRIPDTEVAAAFTSGLLTPFQQATGATSFAVPSIPGARGFSVTVTTPVQATEQVVVFRTGPYVSLLQLASSASASNPAPLSSAQAISVSYQQLTVLQAALARSAATGTAAGRSSPGGAATTGSATRPSVAPATPPATVTTAPSWTAVDTALVVVALVAVILVVAMLGRRRRDGPPRRTIPADAWAPGGILAHMGAQPVTGQPPDRPFPVPDLGGGQPPLPVPEVMAGANPRR